MKTIKFSELGGFPGTQDDFDDLQSGLTQAVTALAMMGGTEPFKLYGMVSSDAGGGVTNVSAGWFFYDGRMIRFPAQSYPAVGSGNDIYVVITPTSSGPLPFADASTPDYVYDETGVLTELVNTTPIDSTHFKLSALVPFGKGFGQINRESAWQTITVAMSAGSGGVGGTIKYKKDHTSNMLLIQGTLTANNADNFASRGAGSGRHFLSMGSSIPASYYPNANFTSFTANILSGSLFKDDLDVNYVYGIAGYVANGGTIGLDWIKPSGGLTTYTVYFNIAIPRD